MAGRFNIGNRLLLKDRNLNLSGALDQKSSESLNPGGKTVGLYRPGGRGSGFLGLRRTPSARESEEDPKDSIPERRMSGSYPGFEQETTQFHSRGRGGGLSFWHRQLPRANPPACIS